MAPSHAADLLEGQFKAVCTAIGAVVAAWRGSDVIRARLDAAAHVLIDHGAMHVAVIQVEPNSRDVTRTRRDALLATRTMLAALDRAAHEGMTPELRRATIGTRHLLDVLTPSASPSPRAIIVSDVVGDPAASPSGEEVLRN